MKPQDEIVIAIKSDLWPTKTGVDWTVRTLDLEQHVATGRSATIEAAYADIRERLVRWYPECNITSELRITRALFDAVEEPPANT